MVRRVVVEGRFWRGLFVVDLWVKATEICKEIRGGRTVIYIGTTLDALDALCVLCALTHCAR